ncbi:MAG: DUF2961 domain-containing protein [Chloroflexi bacterium]|nr:DUF2961 domain-containing protein [Chloroflexota bacterium]
MEMGMTSLASLARLGRGVKSRRHSSYNTTGSNMDFWVIGPGETAVLGEMSGPGCIRHIWMTTDEENFSLRGLVLRIYWDGETTPSVQCPLGDFFGIGHAKAIYFISLPLQTFMLGLNCWFAMPYATGARITVTNEAEWESRLFFYIDYQEWNTFPPDLGRFHACWRRELVRKEDDKLIKGSNGLEQYTWRGKSLGRIQPLNTTGADNYVILEAEGQGHYVGCTLHVDSNQQGTHWLEGDDMIFVDGEPWPPKLHGTGMEDYFCGAFGYNGNYMTYNAPYSGYHFKGNEDCTGKHSQYRFHIEDPVYFEESIRVTIEHGHANDSQGDWCSTAYWYQVGRTKPLPDLGTFADRLPYAFGGLRQPTIQHALHLAGRGKDRSELSR